MLTHFNRGKAFYSTLFRLALPIILQNVVASSMGVFDTFMVGSLGEEAIAAVTAANIPVFMLQLIIFGFQSGSTVLVAQFWGKRDMDAINRVLGIGLMAVGAVSGVFAVAMTFFSAPFLGLFSNSPSTVALAAEYARLVGFSYLLSSLSQLYLAAHRSMENPRIGFYILSVSMVTDTFLNWVMIYGKLGVPRMGIAGAALSTLFARMLEFVIVILYATRTPRFRIQPSKLLRPGGAMLRRFVRYGSPVVVNEALWGIGAGLYPTIMGHMEGSTRILAGFALSRNVDMICTAAVFALANASAILIGNEIGGGGARDKVYRTGGALSGVSFLAGLLFGGLMAALTLTVLPAYVYPLFRLSEEAAGVTSQMLLVMALFLPLRSVNATSIVGVLRGGGDVRAATLIDIVPLWLITLPGIALAGLVFKAGILAVILMRQLEEIVKFALSIWRFQSRKWIHDVTEADPEELPSAEA